MPKGKTTGSFNKQYIKLILSQPELRETIDSKIKLFVNKPEDTRLRNHSLKRRLRGKWAFSITNDIRIIYEKRGNNQVRFLQIGTHKEVYTKKTK